MPKELINNVTKAPQRSLYKALGLADSDLEKSIVGVFSAFSEIVPGHTHLNQLAEAVKAGVYMSGGTPVLLSSIGVCDGLAMGHAGMRYSLPSR